MSAEWQGHGGNCPCWRCDYRRKNDREPPRRVGSVLPLALLALILVAIGLYVLVRLGQQLNNP